MILRTSRPKLYFSIAAVAFHLLAFEVSQAFGQQEVTGACCTFPGVCQVQTAAECNELDGIFNGNGSDFFQGSCDPQGTCCFPTDCTIQTEAICKTQVGSYQGNGVACRDVLCTSSDDEDDDESDLGGDPNEREPCCVTGGTCEVQTRQGCKDVGGIFLGPGTCDGVNCSDPPGACCDGNTCITVLAASLCQSPALFLGPGSTCDNVTSCEGIRVTTVGTCCVFEGSTVRRERLSFGDCAVLGRQVHGIRYFVRRGGLQHLSWDRMLRF